MTNDETRQFEPTGDGNRNNPRPNGVNDNNGHQDYDTGRYYNSDHPETRAYQDEDFADGFADTGQAFAATGDDPTPRSASQRAGYPYQGPDTGKRESADQTQTVLDLEDKNENLSDALMKMEIEKEDESEQAAKMRKFATIGGATAFVLAIFMLVAIFWGNGYRTQVAEAQELGATESAEQAGFAIQGAEQQRDEALGERDAANDHAADLQQQLDVANGQRDHAEGERDQLQDDIEDRIKDIEERDKRIEELEREVGDLQDRQRDMERDLRDSRDRSTTQSSERTTNSSQSNNSNSNSNDADFW